MNIKIFDKIIAVSFMAFLLLFTACPDPQNPNNGSTETVARPTASPSGGTFDTAQTVSLSTTTQGASIYYTTNGADPTSSSTLYTSPITISQTTTLKAIGIRDGMNNSSILTVTFTIGSGHNDPNTVATPTASPQGGTYATARDVSLSTTTQGASIYYTTDGSDPTVNSTLYTSPISISTTTTLKAIGIMQNMNNSGIMTEIYTITGEQAQTFNLSELGNLGNLNNVVGVTATLTIPLSGNATLDIFNYSDPASFASFNLPQDIRNLLAGRNLIVDIQKGTSTSSTVSLTYVHHLRQALQTAVGSGSVSINSTNLTPEFVGSDWWRHEGTDITRNLYNAYSNATASPGIGLMNGVTVFQPSTGKFIIEYDRNLVVKDIVYPMDNNNVTPSFIGFGIRKKLNSSASLQPSSGNWADVTIYSGHFSNALNTATINNPLEYYQHLSAAGLLPSQNAFPNHNVNVTNTGNIAANGMYDLILGYYNPGENGSLVGNRDFRSRLPSFGGATFDGLTLTPGITSRNIGSTTPSNNMYRKGSGPAVNAPTHVTGQPNANFIGNITVPMANWLRASANNGPGITEFRNTNIVGPGSEWTNLVLPHLTNVGLIGNYGGLEVNNGVGRRIRGVLDITGTAPANINNDEKNGYINLWNVPSNNIAINNFSVIFIRNPSNVNRVNAMNPWSTSAVPANVIIYSQKYPVNTVNNESANLRPEFRAFLNADTPRIVPVTGSPVIDASYKGTNTTGGSTMVPTTLLEMAWINAANGSPTTPPADNNVGMFAAPNFQTYTAALSASPPIIWDNAAFNNIVASLSPMQSDIRLASGGMPQMDAIVPLTLDELLRRRGRSSTYNRTA